MSLEIWSFLVDVSSLIVTTAVSYTHLRAHET